MHFFLDDEDILQHHGSIGGSDEVIHIHKESKLGGNICSKIVFFCLLGALGFMISLIIIEYHGTNDGKCFMLIGLVHFSVYTVLKFFYKLIYFVSTDITLNMMMFSKSRNDSQHRN